MSSVSNHKRALITGAAMGLGKAMADQLVDEGWQVVTVDRELISSGKTTHMVCDLSDHKAVDALLKQMTVGTRFDLVVMNAAISASGKFEAMPLTAYEKLIALNVETPMIMASQLAATRMFSKQSHLVFISSLSHYTGYPGASVYGASKDAIAVYAKSIRKPFAKIGVSVSCVFPGPLKTAQADRHAPKGANAEKRMSPEEASKRILKDVQAKKHLVFPGGGPKVFALFGKFLPSIADRAMRKIIYEKLDKDVY